MAERIRIFFHGIANEDQRPDPLPPGLSQRVIQHRLDLGFAAQAGNTGKPPREVLSILQKGCRAEFTKAAIIRKRYGKPANTLRRLQHFCRQPGCVIPGTLPRCRGINGKEQPRRRAGGYPQRWHTRRLVQKGGDSGGGRAGGWRFTHGSDVVARPVTSNPVSPPYWPG
jgi:hypothetical protein